MAYQFSAIPLFPKENSKPKRILFFGLNFSPEPIGVGKYTGDLADYLVQKGIDLRVVTAPPYYPEWKVKKGYSGCTYSRETVGKMKVYRCPLWVPQRVTSLGRLLHLLSFCLSSFPEMLAQLIWKPDIIVCFIPTLFSAPIGWLVARLSGAKCWLHIQDYELDTALNLDMMPGRKLLRSIAQAFESFVLTRFDRVSSISESMLARAVQKGVARKKTFLFPNWVNTHQIFPMQGHNPLRDELGIDKNKKVILYHGNLGRKQGLDILINAALSLQDQSDILFLICGEGVEREDLERRILKMKNVRFVDLQPIEKLNQLVNLADVHVLPQRAGAADLVMPSKLTTMLASGKPVLACASPGTQLWKVVNEVGWVIPPEDTLALTKAIISLVGNRAECQRLGKLGRDFSCKYLEKGYILSEFKKAIDVLIYPSPNYELRSLKSPHYRGFILELLNHFFR